MLEKPSYVSGSNEADQNAILSLIKTTEESLSALDRQEASGSISESMRRSIEAQKFEKQKKLEELKSRMDLN